MTTFVVRSWATILLLFLGCATASAEEPRTVLVLYSEQWLTPSTNVLTDSIRKSLSSAPAVVLEAQYLDISRFAGESHDRALADWLQSRYRGRRLAVVVAIGVPASMFATRYGAQIWPAARLVHTSVDGEQARIATARGDAVVPREFHYRRTIEGALQLFPAVRQVWLVAGATEQDRRWLAQAEADVAPLRDRLRVDRVAGLRWDDLQARMKRMPADAIAVLVVFGGDADGRTFVSADALLDLARVANRPVFVNGSWLLGTGAVGGDVLDVTRLGQLTGGAVLRVLDGQDAAPVAGPASEVTRWMFDAAQLRRWNISEATLPPGSVVLNRELPAWRRYLWTLVGMFLLVTVQGGIISALLVQRRNRRRIEAALRSSEAEVRASYDEARDLAGRLISARESERTRIARDLHDDIGQRVASLSIGLSRIQRQMSDAPAATRQSLSNLEQQSTRLSADVRHLSHELHPGALEHLGLLEALRERCDDFAQESGVSVRLEVSEAWRDVSDVMGLCLYRVAQEALRNVATHAKARTVTILLDRPDGHVMMRVADDGCGFDPTAQSSRKGLGLMSVNERVYMLGGVLDVSAAHGAGTLIAVRLPSGESDAPQSAPR